MYRPLLLLILTLLSFTDARARQILIPMDASQTNHLKAYGVIYNYITTGTEAQWLLNYRGGSFMAPYSDELLRTARIRGVYTEVISTAQAREIISEIERNDVNMAAVPLEKAPSIAVYTPDHALPWDDAVTLALEYAEIPYTTIYNREVLAGELENYDWLHLHHEDFYGAIREILGGLPSHPLVPETGPRPGRNGPRTGFQQSIRHERGRCEHHARLHRRRWIFVCHVLGYRHL